MEQVSRDTESTQVNCSTEGVKPSCLLDLYYAQDQDCRSEWTLFLVSTLLQGTMSHKSSPPSTSVPRNGPLTRFPRLLLCQPWCRPIATMWLGDYPNICIYPSPSSSAFLSSIGILRSTLTIILLAICFFSFSLFPLPFPFARLPFFTYISYATNTN